MATMPRQRYSRKDPPHLHSPAPREQHRKLERSKTHGLVCSIALCFFLAMTANICAILALAGAAVLSLRQCHKMASNLERSTKSLLKDAAVFMAVILTNIVLQIVAIANALEPENPHIRRSTSNTSAKMNRSKPGRTNVKRKEKQQALVREYSKSLCESYVPRISVLLEEEAEVARSKTSSSSTRNDSILDTKFDYIDRMWQTASYFADWESYPFDRNNLGLEDQGTVAEGSGGSGNSGGSEDGDQEVDCNPWRTI